MGGNDLSRTSLCIIFAATLVQMALGNWYTLQPRRVVIHNAFDKVKYISTFALDV